MKTIDLAIGHIDDDDIEALTDDDLRARSDALSNAEKADMGDRFADELDRRAMADENDRVELGSLRSGTKHAMEAGNSDVETAKPPLLRQRVDWSEFWANKSEPARWLFDDVLALGRGHAVIAKAKEGKSLFTLWMVTAALAECSDVAIVYLDFEMTSDDLRERLAAMGHSQDSDLSRLFYFFHPDMPPLDTADGGKALMALLESVQLSVGPEVKLCVVIDTFGRCCEGEENDNSTIQSYYRYSGAPMKQSGITTVRLDHVGKDSSKGARGASDKSGDVDVVWHLTKNSDGGFVLDHRGVTRISWVRSPLRFCRSDQTEPLGYRRACKPDWAPEILALAVELAAIGVPTECTVDEANHALKKTSADGRGRSRSLVAGAVRARKVDRQAVERHRRESQSHGGKGTE